MDLAVPLLAMALFATACAPAPLLAHDRPLPKKTRDVVGQVRLPDGGVPSDAVVMVSDAADGALVATISADRTGRFEAHLPEGGYAVSAASREGWAWNEKIDVPTSGLDLTLSPACVPVTGRIAVSDLKGRVSSAVVKFVRISANIGDVFGVHADADGAFSSCLPTAEYAVSVDGELVSIPMAVDVAKSSDVVVQGWPRALVEAAPPDVSIDATSVRAFVAGIPSTARVIALGESNHGSQEFLSLRLETSLELARVRGYRLIMIEAGFAEVLPLDRYIHGEDVDPRKAVEGLHFWMWDTAQFLEALATLRSYNAKAASNEQISLWGLDMQFSDLAVDVLSTNKALSFKTEELELLGILGRDQGKDLRALSPERRAILDSLLLRIERNGESAAETPHFVASMAARSLRHFLAVLHAGSGHVRDPRDVGMADLVTAAVRRTPDARVVVWAHNAHVSREPDLGTPQMGQFLAESLGHAYFPVGIFSWMGQARAWDSKGEVGVISHALATPPRHALESAVMASVLAPVAFAILDHLPTAFRTWLEQPRYVREFGAAFPGERDAWTLRVVPRAFDAIAVVRVTSDIMLTATGVRSASDP